MLSLRLTRLPISRKSFGSFSFGSAGTGSFAAAAASSPKVARRPDLAWLTTPSRTLISAGDTCHFFAAAPTSMARPAAPAWRSCSQELAIAVLPPVPWNGPHARLL